jgi:hypothetical protein
VGRIVAVITAHEARKEGNEAWDESPGLTASAVECVGDVGLQFLPGGLEAADTVDLERAEDVGQVDPDRP